jgi:uncharacterized protein (DUF433 family)
MATPFAFTLEQAARLSGLSVHQVRYWADTGFFTPTHRCEPGRPFGRIYSFRDIVGLRTLALLRNQYQVPLQQLRRVGKWLDEHYGAPWAELRFFVAGREVLFRDPHIGQYRSGLTPEQTIIPIELEAVAAEAEADARRLRERAPDEYGVIRQHRYVAHNSHVIEGTRIRTEAIWNFHEAGYSVEEIVGQYPRLVEKDVVAAIEFEANRRKQDAS